MLTMSKMNDFLLTDNRQNDMIILNENVTDNDTKYIVKEAAMKIYTIRDIAELAGVSVATVSRDGVVTPVAKGEVKITATAGDKHKTLKVTVVAPRPSKVQLVKGGKKLVNNKTYTLKKGRSVTMKVALTPAFAETSFIWKSDNKTVATVSQKGKVKGVRKGIATITLTTGNGLRARVKVRVK